MTTENQGACADFEESLELLLDGELESDPLTRFETHLESCPACRAELVAARRLREALADLPIVEAPRGAVAAILATARAEAKGSTEGRFRWVAQAPYLAALAALLAIAFGLSWWLSPQPEAVEAPTAYAAAEVERATLETKLALAHIARAGRQIGLEIEDEVSDRWLAPTVRRFRGKGPREPRDGESTPSQERG